ncbi:MAG: DEAD/DEAH box helicase family protein [Treponema sp.]|uniref:helicase C-terminal domain-containing protein n=1 Tax=Treponema sp. TaxID=166 RepID=UPI0025E2F774|nr:helicase C-terminal domain-containing protein [Treponema sp.]MBQ9281219.1 DEAD/DEAH box helicase family protein [Treponema sp.]
MEINRRFSLEVRQEMKRQIEMAGGNEVFFAGIINAEGVVISVQAGSRGNSDSVPVNFSFAREASVLIHNHPSGNLHPSDADLMVASDASEKAQGFYIVNNDVSEVYVVMEPIKPVVTKKLDCDETALYLSSSGPLAKISPYFEERPSQIELVKEISSAFNDESVGVFEAGTGVGKSFAYLIPSMLWAINNKERVVISTGTINLQQQLSEKDIPQAEKIIGKKVKSILVKGRQNYVCLRRLSEVGNERDLFSDETEIFDKIASWAKESKTGSKSDLSFMPPENLWQRVNSEADACMGMRCKFREKCFVMKVRKEAADANILVVNHHMLFADIESRMNGAGYDDTAVLPPYKRIVFDEAHGIEDAATSFFSNSLNRFRILKQLNLLYRQRKASSTGYIFTLSALSNIEDKSDLVKSEIERAKESIANLEESAAELLAREFNIRLFSGSAQRFSELIRKITVLQKNIAAVCGITREIIDGISEDDLDDSVIYEAKAVLRRLDSMVETAQNFVSWEEHPENVFWVAAKRLPPSMAKNFDNPFYYEFNETPLDIASLMNKGVYEPMKSIVCTSATLSISRTFDFWKKRVGINFIEKERVKSGEFLSPFPYEKNMVFAVPSDAPFPDSENFQAFVENALVQMIEAAGGKTLVLFTAYDSLRHACDTVRTRLRSSGITVLKQGDDDRFRLLSQFKDEVTSCLFATDSFWEGVDVPGESLSLVIIVKMPFGVPSDPVFAARSEEISKKGGFPFMELSVPQAVIKFRQGFGRLIRRGDDRGAVVALDRRIIEKSYGRMFTQSIPETPLVYKPLSEVISEVRKYCK